MVLKYPYAYARIRARKSKLLIYRKEELINKSFKELVLLLIQEGYLKDISPEDINNIKKIEVALYNNLARDFGTILKFIPDSAKPLFLTYYEKLNIMNAKNILRAKLTRKKELLELIIPTLEVPNDVILEALYRDFDKGLQQLIECYKRKPYYRILLSDVKDYDTLLRLEAELDSYFLSLISKFRELEEIGKVLIDFYNIKFSLAGINKFVPGGKLSKEELPKTFPFKLTKYKELGEIKDYEEFEEKFDQYIINLSSKLFSKSFFSPLPYFGYALLKEYEIRFIRRLLIMKYYHLQ